MLTSRGDRAPEKHHVSGQRRLPAIGETHLFPPTSFCVRKKTVGLCLALHQTFTRLALAVETVHPYSVEKTIIMI